MRQSWRLVLLSVGDFATNALHSHQVAVLINRHIHALAPNDFAILMNPAAGDTQCRTILKGGLQSMPVVRMDDLECSLRVGIELLWRIAEHILDGWIDVLAAYWIVPIAKNEVFSVFN